jgi:biotin carboxyl carrier protein
MKLLITVEGRSYEVHVQVLDESGAPPVAAASAPRATPASPASASAPVAAAAAASAPASAGGKVLKAPIVGTVVKVLVKPGDTVAKNQPVLVMEAMKMETNVAAPDAGTVKAVRINPGQAVKAGDVLVEFE